MHIFPSPVGVLTLTATEEGLTGLYLREPTAAEHALAENAALFAHTEKWLERYFRGERPSPAELTLAPQGSEFRMLVWKLLLEIPYGETISYGELARRIGNEKACRAVGMANHANRIPIIIPCHRVVGANGRLTGYGGGLEIKRILLETEGIDVKI